MRIEQEAGTAQRGRTVDEYRRLGTEALAGMEQRVGVVRRVGEAKGPGGAPPGQYGQLLVSECGPRGDDDRA
jgi:hypothetical protein